MVKIQEKSQSTETPDSHEQESDNTGESETTPEAEQEETEKASNSEQEAPSESEEVTESEKIKPEQNTSAAGTAAEPTKGTQPEKTVIDPYTLTFDDYDKILNIAKDKDKGTLPDGTTWTSSNNVVALENDNYKTQITRRTDGGIEILQDSKPGSIKDKPHDSFHQEKSYSALIRLADGTLVGGGVLEKESSKRTSDFEAYTKSHVDYKDGEKVYSEDEIREAPRPCRTDGPIYNGIIKEAIRSFLTKTDYDADENPIFISGQSKIRAIDNTYSNSSTTETNNNTDKETHNTTEQYFDNDGKKIKEKTRYVILRPNARDISYERRTEEDENLKSESIRTKNPDNSYNFLETDTQKTGNRETIITEKRIFDFNMTDGKRTTKDNNGNIIKREIYDNTESYEWLSTDENYKPSVNPTLEKMAQNLKDVLQTPGPGQLEPNFAQHIIVSFKDKARKADSKTYLSIAREAIEKALLPDDDKEKALKALDTLETKTQPEAPAPKTNTAPPIAPKSSP